MRETNENKALIVFDAPELQSIEESKAIQIKATFEPMAVMLADLKSLKIKYSFESDENREMYSYVSKMINEIINYVEKS